ncbi:MAG: FkbM family methyltransferase [Selenomonadaceae bacterium]|nr:FkbM family methyltransferase [Selenomonadaceae bacterium]
MKTDVSFIEIDEYKFPLAYRPNTSDLPTARVIFERGDYFLEYTGLLAFFNGNFKPRFIIDGGANVGYASVFFANRYPECEKILAIEPEIENFEILQYNTQNYPQIQPIRAALWNREIDLSVALDGIHKTPDAFMTSESIAPNIETTQGITIGKIFRESGFPFIDILKLDVEGAEKEIFSDEGKYWEWLPFVKVLIIELHDRMKRGCSRNLFRAMGFYETFFAFSGENLIFIREDLL